MKKTGKINYRRSLLGIFTLMSSSALLVTSGAHASTVSVADMNAAMGKGMHHKAMFHKLMDTFSNDGIDDEVSDDKGYRGDNHSNGRHGFSPFSSDKPYGLMKNEQDWKPRWFSDESHHFTPFGSEIPPGLRKHRHKWEHHPFNKEDYSVVPVPAAAWLFGSGLMGLISVVRRKKVSI